MAVATGQEKENCRCLDRKSNQHRTPRLYTSCCRCSYVCVCAHTHVCACKRSVGMCMLHNLLLQCMAAQCGLVLRFSYAQLQHTHCFASLNFFAKSRSIITAAQLTPNMLRWFGYASVCWFMNILCACILIRVSDKYSPERIACPSVHCV